MKLNSNFIITNVMDNDVLIDTTGKHNGLFKLNATSKKVVELLSENKTREEIIDTMFDMYDVDKDTLSNDIDSIIDTLKKVNALDD